MPESCPAWLALGFQRFVHAIGPPDCPDVHHWRDVVNIASGKLFRSCILRWTANCLLRTQSGFMLEHKERLMKTTEGLGDFVVIHALDPEDASAIIPMRTAGRTQKGVCW